MFGRIAKVNKARRTVSEIEKIQEQIQASAEKSGVRVIVNANHKVVSVEIDGMEDKLIKDLLNDAFKQAKKKSEKKLRSMASEFDLKDFL